MLGVLDVEWEVEHEDEVDLVTFAGGKFPLVEERPLAHEPFTEAIAGFRSRNVMPRAAFDLLSREAKRKAFTVARLAKQDLLDAAHAELLRQLERSGKGTRKDPATGKWIYEGPNLREFRKFAAERLESAGWTPANPSHVETIYRTNIVGAYSTGRHAQMASPSVVQRMPYWQIRGVTDDRQRDTHKRAHGIILRADHAFWKKAFPPFGFNCRCRVIARSQAWVDRTGAVIGPVPQGLPDPGFDSGTRSMPAIPAALQATPPAPPPGQPRQAPPPPIATQSGPARPPAAIPVTIPAQAPQLVPRQPISPPLPPPRRPIGQQTFEQMGVTFYGKTPKEQAITHERFQEIAQKLFGTTLDPQQVLRIAGTQHLAAFGVPEITAFAEGNQLSISAIYRDAAGRKSAEIMREFYKGADGPVAYHALFKLPKKLRGRGTAKLMNRDAFQDYARLGVKQVRLTAAWTGRYTWPRMGFRWAGNAASFDALVTRFEAFMTGRGVTAPAIATLKTRIKTIHDLARSQSGGIELGKEFLTGLPEHEMFPLEMKLNPTDPGFVVASEYLGL